MKGIKFDLNCLGIFKKIFVLVSGGIDSTYLYEKIKKIFPEKTFPVNCYNPYESSITLDQISKDPKFIQIKPKSQYNYGQILRDAFLQLPQAFKKKKEKKYNKKIFGCCYYIKHKAFLEDPLFKEEGTVVITGIKAGDGKQRGYWLKDLRKKETYFHKHKGGQLYCYPFRDYFQRELPLEIRNKLKKKYPRIKHSGCVICPVLVLFGIKKEKRRYYDSIRFAEKLDVIKQVQKTLVYH
jgi:3'-phosphoadenosine 5'-phosphosulfate sulfotransferase (PAPS reductase)/FAD synthetase